MREVYALNSGMCANMHANEEKEKTKVLLQAKMTTMLFEFVKS